MKTPRYVYHLSALITVVTFLAACDTTSRRHIAATLDDVETFINERPDSALAVLEGADSTVLTTRNLRARYSLLHVMALDKCYKDITAPGLLDEASKWYEHHGTADEKMKSLYYQGRIAQDRKDQNSAAVFYAMAEEYADRVTDLHTLGLLYLAEASLYNAVYNVEKEKEYVERALSVFEQSEDPIIDQARGRLALVFHRQKDWSRADSLYQIGLRATESNEYARSVFLSNYALMKVQRPEKDPEGTIELLNQKRALSGNGLTPQEAGAYAYALARTGAKTACMKWKLQLETLTGQARYDVLPWLMRISRLEGDSESAFEFLTEARGKEETVIAEYLSNTITQALKDYYEQRSQQERERKLQLGLCTMGAIAVLLVLMFLLYARERHVRSDLDRLVSIRSALEQELTDQENRAEAVTADLSIRLGALRSQLQKERLDRLRNSGRYGYWIWMEQHRRYSDKEVIKFLRKDLREVCTLETSYTQLANRLDCELDGLFSRLKKDLHIISHSEGERFLCYWLIDLRPDMVAELMNITPNNVYVKTHRLVDRIRQLGKPEYDSLVKE